MRAELLRIREAGQVFASVNLKKDPMAQNEPFFSSQQSLPVPLPQPRAAGQAAQPVTPAHPWFRVRHAPHGGATVFLRPSAAESSD